MRRMPHGNLITVIILVKLINILIPECRREGISFVDFSIFLSFRKYAGLHTKWGCWYHNDSWRVSW